MFILTVFQNFHLKNFPRKQYNPISKRKKSNPLSQIQLRSANKQKFNNFWLGPLWTAWQLWHNFVYKNLVETLEIPKIPKSRKTNPIGHQQKEAKSGCETIEFRFWANKFHRLNNASWCVNCRRTELLQPWKQFCKSAKRTERKQ